MNFCISRFFTVGALCALLFASSAVAQLTPNSRQRNRRHVLEVYNDKDTSLAVAAVAFYSRLHPEASTATFARSSYWHSRKEQSIRAVAVLRVTEHVQIDAASEFAFNKRVDSLRAERASIGADVAGDYPAHTAVVRYNAYLFAQDNGATWEVFETGEDLSPTLAGQQEAALELTIAKRQERYAEVR